MGNTADPLDFGNYDPTAMGIGPYSQEFTEFQDPLTLLGKLYDIFTGVAEGGNIQWGPGTPGTLKDDLSLELANMRINAGLYKRGTNPAFFGGTAKLPGIGLNPNRNKTRPWWAK